MGCEWSLVAFGIGGKGKGGGERKQETWKGEKPHRLLSFHICPQAGGSPCHAAATASGKGPSHCSRLRENRVWASPGRRDQSVDEGPGLPHMLRE